MSSYIPSSEIYKGTRVVSRPSPATLQSLIEELETAIKVCPNVGPQGESEVPFARELYQQKETALRTAEKAFADAERWIPVFQQEMSEASKTQQVVQSDRPRIRGAKALEAYGKASREAEQGATQTKTRYQNYQTLIQSLMGSIARAKSLGNPYEKLDTTRKIDYTEAQRPSSLKERTPRKLRNPEL